MLFAWYYVTGVNNIYTTIVDYGRHAILNELYSKQQVNYNMLEKSKTLFLNQGLTHSLIQRHPPTSTYIKELRVHVESF